MWNAQPSTSAITNGAHFDARLHRKSIEGKTMEVTLKNLVKNTTACFVCYRDGDLWYRVEIPETATVETPRSFEFPVPIADTGTGIFPAQVKAITLMRWIRKQMDKVHNGEWG